MITSALHAVIFCKMCVCCLCIDGMCAQAAYDFYVSRLMIVSELRRLVTKSQSEAV